MLRTASLLLIALLVTACGGGNDARFDNGGPRQLESISVTPATAELPEGLTQQYTATGQFSDGTEEDISDSVAWSSEDAAVASINPTGEALALAQGETTISARQDGISASATLTVTEAVVVATAIEPPAARLQKGTTQDYRAVAFFSNGSIENVTFEADWFLENDSGILAPYEPQISRGLTSLDDFATAVAANVGDDILVATLTEEPSEAETGNSEIVVVDAELVFLRVTPRSATTLVGATIPYVATGFYADGSASDLTKVATWSSDDAAIMSISNLAGERGVATGVSPGLTRINASYEGFENSTDVEVLAFDRITKIDVFPPDEILNLGAREAYQAIAYLEDGTAIDVTRDSAWAVSDDNVAFISNATPSQGVLQTLGTGETTVSAEFSDQRGEAHLEVRSRDDARLLEITIEPVDSTMQSLTSQQFLAFGRYDDGSTRNITREVVWGSDNGRIIQMSNSDLFGRGLGFALEPGTTEVTATLGQDFELIVGRATVTVLQTGVIPGTLVVSPATAVALVGDNQQFTATLMLDDGRSQDVTEAVVWTSSEPGVAEIDNTGLATAEAPGKTDITASLRFVGNPITATATLLVEAPDTIEDILVDPARAEILTGETQAYTARALLADGTTVDITDIVFWSSGDSAVAQIDLDGVAIGIAPGNTSIQALFEYEGESFTGTAALTVKEAPVTVVSIAVTPVSTRLFISGTQQFTATALLSDGTSAVITDNATWSTADAIVAHVSSSGIVTGLNPGQTTVAAEFVFAGERFTDSATVEVLEDPIADFVLSPGSASIAVGSTQQFSALVTLDNGEVRDVSRDAAWTSADPLIAQVDPTGFATGLTEGTTVISAVLSAGGTSYTATATLRVKAEDVELVDLQLEPPLAQVLINGTRQYIATAYFSDGSSQDVTTDPAISYASTDTGIATISATGLATGLSGGQVELQASYSYQGTVFSAVATLFVVSEIITIDELIVSPPEQSVLTGGTTVFTARVVLSNGTSLDVTRDAVWSSSDPAIADVDPNTGITTGISGGEAQIIATLTLGQQAVSDSADITVIAPNPEITQLVVNPPQADTVRGGSQQFSATAVFDDGTVLDVTDSSTLSWRSADTGIATISSSGLATGINNGATTITAILFDQGSDLSDSAVFTVGSSDLEITELRVTPPSETLLIGESTQLTATALFADGGSADVTTQSLWQSGDTSIAVVNSRGQVEAVGIGTAEISAEYRFGGTTYRDISTITVEVSEGAEIASLSIAPANASILIGQSRQYEATAILTTGETVDVTTRVSWQSSDSSIAQMEADGRALGLSTGIVTITGTLEFGGDIFTDIGTLTVKPTNASVLEIQVAPVNAEILVGGKLQYSATALLSDGSNVDISSNVSWTTAAPDIATISTDGRATGVSVGDTTVTATFEYLGELFSDSTGLSVLRDGLDGVELRLSPATSEIIVGSTQSYTAEVIVDGISRGTIDASQLTWTSSNTAIADIQSDGVAIGVAEGAADIIATFSANGDTISDSSRLQVKPEPVVPTGLRVEPLSASILTGERIDYQAWLLLSDGSEQLLPASESNWVSDDESIASISQAGRAEGVAPGDTFITASYLENGFDLSDSAPIEVKAAPVTITEIVVDPPRTDTTEGATSNFTATALLSDGSSTDVTLTASWSSSDDSIAEITGPGQALATGAGAAEITASVSEDGALLFDTSRMRVIAAPVTVIDYQITPADAEILTDTRLAYTATAFLSDGSSVDVTGDSTWSSSDPTIAEINSSGRATAISDGVTAITGRAVLDGITWEDTTSLTVIPEDVTVVALELTPASSAITIGATEQYSATAVLSNGDREDVSGDVVWSSAPTAVAEIDSTGLALGIAEGDAVITARLDVAGDITEGTASLRVKPPAVVLERIEVTPQFVDIYITDDGVQFRAEAFFSDGTSRNVTQDPDTTWRSLDGNIAHVDTTGFVTGLAEGSTNIEATYINGEVTATDSGEIQVKGAELLRIEVSPANTSVAAGVSASFTATAVYADGDNVDVSATALWQSSDESVATVDSTGQVDTLIPGRSEISATYEGLSDAGRLTVTEADLVDIQIDPRGAEGPVGTTADLKLYAEYTDGALVEVTRDAIWSSGDDGIATVNGRGLVTFTGVGTTQVSAEFGSLQDSVDVTGTDPVLTDVYIEPVDEIVGLGTQVPYVLFGVYSDGSAVQLTEGVTWRSTEETIATIDADGLADTHLQGVTTIRAVYTGEDVVAGRSLPTRFAQTSLTVTDATVVSVTILEGDVTGPSGTSEPLTLQAEYTDGTTEDVTRSASWSSSDDSAVSVVVTGENAGIITYEAVASADISAAFEGQSDTVTATGTAAIVSRLVVTPFSREVPLGLDQQFTARAIYTDGAIVDVSADPNIDWLSSNESVATVGISGLANAVGLGDSTISASFGGQSAGANMTVIDSVVVSLRIDPASLSGPAGTGATLRLLAVYSDGPDEIDVSADATWLSADTSVATVGITGATGGITRLEAVGNTTITATFDETDTTAAVEVTDAILQRLEVSPVNESVAAGYPVQYVATGIYTNNTTEDLTLESNWSSSDTAIATIDGNGLARTKAQGSSTISATYAGLTATSRAGQTELSDDTTLNVTAAVLQSIAIDGPVQGPAGTEAQATATATYSDASTRDVTEESTWTTADPSIATVIPTGTDAGLLNLIVAGGTTLTAQLDGQSDTVNVTVTAPILERIEVSPASASIPDGLTQQFTAVAWYSDDSFADVSSQAVWSSSAEAIATVNDAGLATGQSEGSSTISASFQSFSDDAALEVTAAVITDLRIDPSDVTGPAGTEATLELLATYSNGQVVNVEDSAVWTSSTPTSVLVGNGPTRGGRLALISEGQSTITAAYLDEAPVTAQVTVTAAELVRLELSPQDEQVAAGITVQYTANGVYTDNSVEDLTTQVAWNSSATAVATIDSAGLASTYIAGTTTISASYTDGGAPVQASTSLTVTAAEVTAVAILPGPITGPVGFEDQLTLQATYTDGSTADVTTLAGWQSDNTPVATVVFNGANAGLVSYESEGSATISASFGGQSDAVTATVTEAVVTGLVVTPTKRTIPVGLKKKFRATAYYSDGTSKNVSRQSAWSTKDQAIATVNKRGRVKGRSVGVTTVSAIFEGFQDDGAVNVTEAVVTGIEIFPGSVTGPVGTDAALTLYANYSDRTQEDITDDIATSWLSDDTSVAEVSSTGIGAGETRLVGEGDTLIRATFSGFEDAIPVTATAAELVELVVTPADASVAAGLKVQYTAIGIFTDTGPGTPPQNLTKVVNWASDNTTVAVIGSSGDNGSLAPGEANTLVTGTTNISATYLGTTASLRANQDAVTGSVPLTVTAAEVTGVVIEPGAVDGPAGTEQQRELRAFYTDGTSALVTTSVDTSWSVADTSIASVVPEGSEAGLVSLLVEGTTTLTANFRGTDFSDSVNVTVQPAVLEGLLIEPADASIPVGTTQQYQVTAVYSDASQVDVTASAGYSSGDGAIAIINNTGLAEGISEGSTTIEASFDNESVTANLTVTEAIVTGLRIVPGAIDAPLGTTQQLQLFASFSDDTEQDVTTEAETLFVSSDPSIATVTPNGAQAGFTTLTGVGSTSIVATFRSETASINVNVTAAEVVEISIDPEDASSPSGIDVRYRAYGTYTDGTVQELVSDVTWQSSNLNVARMTIIEQGGEEQAFAETLAEGTTTITATYTAPTAALRAILSPISASTSLTVTTATVTEVQILPATVTAPVGTGQPLQLLATYSDGTQDDVTLNANWVSANPAIASVGTNGPNAGRLSINGVGSTEISASFDGANDSITVTGTAAIIDQLVVQPQLQTTPTGVDVSFVATGIYTDGTSENVSDASAWKSSAPAIASVDGSGNVQALAAGTATISANFQGIADDGDVLVTAPVLDRVEVSPASASLPVGTSEQLTLTAIYSDGSEIDVTSGAFWKTSNSSVATVGASTGQVSAQSVGSATITGTFENLSDSSDITVTAPALESITVSPASESVPVGQSAQFTASGSYSDGSSKDITLDVTWGTSDTAIAVIDNTGNAQTLAPGTVSVTASLSGITGNASLEVLDLQVISIAIQPFAVTAVEGSDPQQLRARATFSDGTTQDVTTLATWFSSSPTVAAVVPNGNEAGLVSFLSPGTATVSATYSGVSGQAAINVEPIRLLSIDVTPQDASIAAGQTEDYSALGRYSDGSSQDISAQVTWSSSNTDAATINASGTAQGVAAGTTTISATLDTVTGSAELEVTAKELVYLRILPIFVNGPAGDMGTLRALALFTDLSVENVTAQSTWTVDDDSVATLGTPGATTIDYTLVAEGSTEVTVTFSGTSHSIPVNVSAAELVSISLSPAMETLPAGLQATFIATGTYTDGSSATLTDEATWTSSDSGIAEITGKGLSTGRAAGTATITASYQDIDGTATHTVTPAEITALFIDPPEWTDPAGTSHPFEARALYTDGSDADVTRDVTWASEDTAIATVDNDGLDKGLVKLEAQGVTDITATIGSITARSTVTVTAPVIVDLFIEPYDETYPDGGFLVQFSAIAVFSDESQSDVTAEAMWYSSDPTVAIPDEDGAVYTVSPGTASISASYGDETGFAPINVVAATVESIQIEPGSVEDPKGTQLQLEAWAFYNNGKSELVTTQATWSSVNNGIAFVIASGDEAGLLTLVEVGMTSVSASFGGSTQSIPVEVTEAVLVDLQIQPKDVAQPLGIDQQFEAIGIYSDGSSGPIFSQSGKVFTTRLTEEVVWNSDTPAVATINGAGFAESLSVGSTVISASYQGFSDSTTMTVQAAEITSLQVTPFFNAGPVGTTVQLTVTATYTDTGDGQSGQDVTDLVEWTSSNGFIATVSKGGLLSFNGASGPDDPGAVLTAKLEGVTGTAVAVGTAAVLDRITLTPDPLNGKVNLTSIVTAIGYYTDGSSEVLNEEADWQIADPSVATVGNGTNNGGAVTGVAEGTTTVTATVGELSASGTVNIAPVLLTGIQVTPSNVIGVEGTSRQLTATGFYEDGSSEDITAEVTWIPEDASVATVTNGGVDAGTLRLLSTGATRISATLDEQVDFVNVLVTAATLEEIEITPADAEIPKGATQQFVATLRFSNGSFEQVTEAEGLTWSSSRECTADITQSGLATGIRFFPFFCVNTTISATKDGVTGEARLTVNRAEIVDLEIQPTGLTEPAGTSGQLEAIATYSDSSEDLVTADATWESSDPSIVQVSNCGALEDLLGCNTGEAFLLAPGTATVTARYEGLEDTSEIVVTDAELVDIIVTPAFESLAEGLTQQYSAEGVFSDGQQTPINGDVTWRATDQDIASITQEGLATALGAGETEITASLGDITGAATLEVTDATVEFIQVFPAVTDPIFVGGLQQFTAEATFTNGESVEITGDVDWSVSPRQLGTFIPFLPGLFQGQEVGLGTVEASYRAGLLQTLTDAVDIVVIEPEVVSIEIDTGRAEGEPVVMTRGIPEDWTATALLDNGRTQDVTLSVLWTTADEEIASVSLGRVDPISVGGTTISATYTPGAAGARNAEQSVSDSVNLTVEAPALLSLEVTPVSAETIVGGNVLFRARAFYDGDPDGVDVTTEAEWTSSNTAVAEVLDGEAQALSIGTTQITATLEDQSDFGTLTVSQRSAEDTSVYPAEVPGRPGEVITMPKEYSQRFIAVARYPDGTISEVTRSSQWASSNTTNVRVANDPEDKKGEATVRDDQDPTRVRISATYDGVTNFEELEVDDDCEFNKKDYELQQMYPQPTDQSILSGESLQMVVSGWYFKDDGEECLAPVQDLKKNEDENDARERLVWEVTSGGDVVEIDEETGIATAVGCGVATIEAEKTKTNTDGDGFDVIRETTTLTVVCP